MVVVVLVAQVGVVIAMALVVGMSLGLLWYCEWNGSGICTLTKILAFV